MADYAAHLKSAVNILVTWIYKMNFKWCCHIRLHIWECVSVKGLKTRNNATNNCITCYILYKCFITSV